MKILIYEHLCATWDKGAVNTPAAQSLYREGRAMLDSCVADWQAMPDVTVIVGTATDFAAQAATADWSIVIAPEGDGLLEQLARQVLAVGGRLAGPSPEAIRLTADKFALYHHWRQHGVPTPDTWLLADAPKDRRLIVKWRDGAGSQDMYWLEPQAERSPVGNRIAQEGVEGLAASVAFLIGPRQTITLVPCAQHFAEGLFAYEGGALPLAEPWAKRAIAAATQAVACVPGFLGYVGVDVVVGEHHAWAIEINPRLTTSYVGLRALAKDNLADVWRRLIDGDAILPLIWYNRLLSFASDGTILQSTAERCADDR